MTFPSDVDARFSLIDQAYGRLAAAAPPGRRWLLVQTLVSGGPRRALLRSLALRPGMAVLDMGCGFGASTLEIAALGAGRVVGLDTDQPVLAVARRAGSEVAAGGGLGPAAASFTAGDAYRLPFADRTFDVVFSRFVFQHLADPHLAAAEIGRILVPGGLACIVDVDDGLSISEPPPSPAFERLALALRASQTAAGGDRRIGRRLPHLLDQAGLTPNPVFVLPQAAYHRPEPGDPERTLMLERLGAARDAIVGGGHMTAAQFDADLAVFSQEAPGPTCEIEAHLAVLARRA